MHLDSRRSQVLFPLTQDLVIYSYYFVTTFCVNLSHTILNILRVVAKLGKMVRVCVIDFAGLTDDPVDLIKFLKGDRNVVKHKYRWSIMSFYRLAHRYKPLYASISSVFKPDRKMVKSTQNTKLRIVKACQLVTIEDYFGRIRHTGTYWDRYINKGLYLKWYFRSIGIKDGIDVGEE
ncbi:hypothetical protein PHYBLDRAFT_67616 [Phycomyces blakesleeanus NRRL 1555(-)]|uniref:Uncharacterized protein n=1 Tax=Phycomyces blakesleeanus (strain ATCC 8743b / DSM 1359 / FGSC 10004 / NBRC 33097 / NRRL 1555) TaxID=763407 RepID=A0A167MXZ3_PHYB8|nr:hypothetical protein PHYBLDRAFT_67616 [Phycomyces blakesleeanus NRRL 1555(-)]OAD74459.1 hypothetical protein PHYBLDRAFT_67616 [Phycomyces blakesleeanus NRRL 1555(-)]|eukprot:XP_018292499.1 hypothetical protein PHYBLDRAFT_67616 [Phycomyces blakesleeanus NRRL 1555(-)]